ncbi:MAG: hypothetical protein KDA81_01075 [Planctomycetaceae bacterium]|nr:hypothetical protein [Planctomycetaceae bacterium]
MKGFCHQFPQEKERRRGREERSRSLETSEVMDQLPNSYEFGYEISSRRSAQIRPLHASEVAGY